LLLLFMQFFASNVGRHSAQEQAVVRSSATPHQREKKSSLPIQPNNYTNIPKTAYYKAYYFNWLITPALIPGFTNPAT